MKIYNVSSVLSTLLNFVSFSLSLSFSMSLFHFDLSRFSCGSFLSILFCPLHCSRIVQSFHFGSCCCGCYCCCWDSTIVVFHALKSTLCAVSNPHFEKTSVLVFLTLYNRTDMNDREKKQTKQDRRREGEWTPTLGQTMAFYYYRAST